MIRRALLAAVVLCHCGPAAAADLVRARSRGGEQFEVAGVVADYTGEELLLTVAGGRQQKIDADRVAALQTTWPDEKSRADAAFAARDWQQAASLYAEANRKEQRTWARRMLLTRLLQCLQALGRNAEAGDLFLILVASDPATPAFRHMPLAWSGDEAVARAKASAWLASVEQPASVLLGASHLLGATSSGEAKPALARLTQLGEQAPRIAQLAEAQLWRTEPAELSGELVDRWARRAERFAPDIQAGPHFLVAQAYRRLGQTDRAVLHYLRAPLLFPEHNRRLSARCLDAAARLLAADGRTTESERLSSELVDVYPESAEAAAEKRRRESTSN